MTVKFRDGWFPCPLCAAKCAPCVDAGQPGLTHELPACVLFRALEVDQFCHVAVLAHRLIPPDEFLERFESVRLLATGALGPCAVDEQTVRDMMGFDLPASHGERRSS